MRYDLSNDYHILQIRARLETLIEKGSTVELTEKRARSMNQNAYLHVCLKKAALDLDMSVELIKTKYLKCKINPDIFWEVEYDPIEKTEEKRLRSTASLTSEETTVVIERFRNWAATKGCYLPSADEYKALLQLETEIDRAKVYLQQS